jgi:hypothetical protein
LTWSRIHVYWRYGACNRYYHGDADVGDQTSVWLGWIVILNWFDGDVTRPRLCNPFHCTRHFDSLNFVRLSQNDAKKLRTLSCRLLAIRLSHLFYTFLNREMQFCVKSSQSMTHGSSFPPCTTSASSPSCWTLSYLAYLSYAPSRPNSTSFLFFCAFPPSFVPMPLLSLPV